jgi:hypothetical protein
MNYTQNRIIYLYMQLPLHHLGEFEISFVVRCLLQDLIYTCEDLQKHRKMWKDILGDGYVSQTLEGLG